MEVIADGDKLTTLVNGQVVNEGDRASLTDGRIMIQSEGAEVYFRKIDLEPMRSLGERLRAGGSVADRRRWAQAESVAARPLRRRSDDRALEGHGRRAPTRARRLRRAGLCAECEGDG